MRLPLLLSVPHAGLRIPDEVKTLCTLSEQDILRDSDEGAEEIYLPLKPEVAAMVSTDIARAIVDMNRREGDWSRDGVVKTHTCWDVPVYREPLPLRIARFLIQRYHRPYHADLTNHAPGIVLGVDCHTMATIGPPTGPDPGVERPQICLSNADGTCPEGWFLALAESLKKTFQTSVSLNHPFKGGYIIRSHAVELPWVQIELSRSALLSNDEKRDRILTSLGDWYKRNR
jgi:formiminoglutamase